MERLKEQLIDFQAKILPELLETTTRAREANNVAYKNLLPTMIAWLNKEGVLRPVDHNEFYRYFLMRYDYIGDFNLLPELTRQDIYDFGKWQEKLIKFTNAVNIKENKFNRMPINEVIEHFFNDLTDTKKNKGEPFLSEGEINLFLNRAFNGEDLNKPKLTLNISAGCRAQAIAIFHKYYSDSKDLKKIGSYRDMCIRLLTDNFDNFDFIYVKANFRS